MFLKTNTYRGHEGAIYTLESYENGKSFFSGGGDKVVTIWQIESGIPTGIVKTNSVIYCIRRFADKDLLVVGVSGGGFHVIDLLQKKELRYIIHHVNGVFDIAYLPEKNKMVTAGADGSIGIWSADNFQLLQSIDLCKGKIRALALNNDKSLMAVACGDGNIRIFSTDNFTLVKDFSAHKESANAVVFHPEKNELISGGKDAHLRIWDLNDYHLIKEIPAHNYAIYSICFSPDLTMMATASRDKTVKLWNANDYSISQRLDLQSTNSHVHSVNKVIWPTQNFLLSAGDDRTINRFEKG